MQKITAVNADCLKVLPKLKRHSVDLVLADLPYGLTKCSWDQVINLKKLWVRLWRILKEGCPAVFFAQQPFISILVSSNISNYRYTWICNKTRSTGFLNAKKCPLKNHEDILVFCFASPTYYPQGLRFCRKVTKRKTSGSCYSSSKNQNQQTHANYPKTVLKFSSVGNPIHSTQKPVDLLEYLIKTYTKEGDLVLDPTAGVMSTGVACMNTNRGFIGIEKDKDIYDKGFERLQNELR